MLSCMETGLHTFKTSAWHSKLMANHFFTPSNSPNSRAFRKPTCWQDIIEYVDKEGVPVNGWGLKVAPVSFDDPRWGVRHGAGRVLFFNFRLAKWRISQDRTTRIIPQDSSPRFHLLGQNSARTTTSCPLLIAWWLRGLFVQLLGNGWNTKSDHLPHVSSMHTNDGLQLLMT